MSDRTQWNKLSRILSLNLVILIYLAEYRTEPERRTIASLTMSTGLGRTAVTKRVTYLRDEGLLIAVPIERPPGSRGPGSVTTWQLTDKGDRARRNDVRPLAGILKDLPLAPTEPLHQTDATLTNQLNATPLESRGLTRPG